MVFPYPFTEDKHNTPNLIIPWYSKINFLGNSENEDWC